MYYIVYGGTHTYGPTVQYMHEHIFTDLPDIRGGEDSDQDLEHDGVPLDQQDGQVTATLLAKVKLLLTM